MKVVANIKTNDGLWKCKNVWYISSKLQLIPLLGTATKMIQITWYLSVKIGLNIYTFKTVVKCSLWVNFTAFYLIPNLFQTFHSYLLMLPDFMTEHWQTVWDEVQMIDQEQRREMLWVTWTWHWCIVPGYHDVTGVSWSLCDLYITHVAWSDACAVVLL